MMESSITNGMCRCCASEGAFKDVKSSYHWMGQEEIYADMLKDCFDIKLCSMDDDEEGCICEVCITQLRNAANFKKQVLHTEEQFKKHLENKIMKTSIVKVEVTADEGDDSDDNNLSPEEGYSGTEFEIPIKTEIPEEPKPRKRAAAAPKATTSRAKKSKIEEGEPSTKRMQQNIMSYAFQPVEVLCVEGPDVNVKIKTEYPEPETENTELKNENATTETKGAKAKISVTLKNKIELVKHHQNLKEVLMCTNATPIQRRGRIGYICFYCSDEYPEATDLKRHTLEIHTTATNPWHATFNKMSEYFIRLDITDLHCVLCSIPINSLDELFQHLIFIHNKMIHTDIHNHIVPFKFDSEQLNCCLCPSVFDKFKMLQEHMHKHYRNHICDVCDSGYVNLGCLNRHKESHRTGTYPCTFCPKVCTTSTKIRQHIRQIHTHRDVVVRCGYCNEGFRDQRDKETHLVEVHGLAATLNKCNTCGKCFSTRKILQMHIKKDHLMERRHSCAECDMKFFRLHELKKHMIKHTGTRNYQCDVCLKSYGRKNTLRDHMRIHNNDRRYKCELCEQAFVQKFSWSYHMKTRHGVIV